MAGDMHERIGAALSDHLRALPVQRMTPHEAALDRSLACEVRHVEWRSGMAAEKCAGKAQRHAVAAMALLGEAVRLL